MRNIFRGGGGHVERRFKEFPFPSIKMNVGVLMNDVAQRVNNHLKRKKEKNIFTLYVLQNLRMQHLFSAMENTHF